MQYFLSCPYGLSSTLNTELKRLGYTSTDSFSRGTYIEGDYDDMYTLNLRSRIANKVYLQLGGQEIESLEDLFEMTKKIERADFLLSKQGVTIKVQTQDSQHTDRTVQSVAQKAIFTKLSGDEKYEFDIRGKSLEVLILIKKNTAKILINTSGESLFKRGWRTQTGDAPLKENIAAALILLAGWKYKQPLHDPFCGSGTICIEAAMLARNIAPGLKRHFGFESFAAFDQEKRDQVKKNAKEKIYDNTYHIHGYDQDANMIAIAQKNAQQAGVENTIIFEKKEFSSNIGYEGWLITNPPYGKRIGNNIYELYEEIGKVYKKNTTLKGGVITIYNEFGQHLEPEQWKWKNLFNGAEEAKFWIKK